MNLPPPLLVAAIMALGWGLRRLWPLPAFGVPEAGVALAAVGLGLAASAVVLMLRAGTDPRPGREPAVLLDRGPFRISRNPIYLGILGVAFGLALLWADGWTWAAAVASALALDRLVVLPEEARLAARFGADYAAYQRRVRRWL